MKRNKLKIENRTIEKKIPDRIIVLDCWQVREVGTCQHDRYMIVHPPIFFTLKIWKEKNYKHQLEQYTIYQKKIYI